MWGWVVPVSIRFHTHHSQRAVSIGYHIIKFGGDDESRTRVLLEINNISISHVYSVIHN